VELAADVVRKLELAGPTPKQQREHQQMRYLLRANETSPRAIARLPAMAVGALKDGVPPQLAEAIDWEHLIDHSRRKQESACIEGGCSDDDAERSLFARHVLDASVLQRHVHGCGADTASSCTPTPSPLAMADISPVQWRLL
jgi:hypothetical protein